MRFEFRKRIGKHRFSLIIGKITDVHGVNSTLEDDNHILMWDFDEAKLNLVKHALTLIKIKHKLPPIHISNSSEGGGYHAYCLARLPWLASLSIVAETPMVDPNYVAMCAYRRHWTLRLSDKGAGVPAFIETLPSGFPEQVKRTELLSWVNYESWDKSKTKAEDD